MPSMSWKETSIELTIDKLSSDAFGMSSWTRPDTGHTYTVEVLGGIPQDRLRVLMTHKKRGAISASIQEILAPSPMRVTPRCGHVPECGGCTFQQMDYSAQLDWKQNRLQKLFASLHDTLIAPILPCKDPYEYRNKMEFSFSQDREGTRYLGLMLKGRKRKVFNLQECHLTKSWFADVVKAVRLWWEESGLAAYHPFADTGSLRTLTVRSGMRTGSKMVMLTVSGNPQFGLKRAQLDSFVKTIETVLQNVPGPTPSVFLQVQQIAKGRPTQFYEMHLSGPAHLTEDLEIAFAGKAHTLNFLISPTSFFQPNPSQAEQIYAHAVRMLELDPSWEILELFSGTGTLSSVLASSGAKVLGVELNPHAVFDAEMNKEHNKLENLYFIRGDVKEIIPQEGWRKHLSKIDALVVDPPRSGIMPEVLDAMAASTAKKILYISCNPQTLERDLLYLKEKGWKCPKIQPIDQFPHTVHVEAIAILERNFS